MPDGAVRIAGSDSIERRRQEFLNRIARTDVLRDICLGRQTGNEENIKVKIVAPILELLGYDPIRDFDYERHVEHGRPDIVLLVEDRPCLIVEAKGLDKDLEDYKAQGLGYSAAAGVPWTILTNGVQWDLYKTVIEGVSFSENEPILTILSRELPLRFAEFEEYISREKIVRIEQTAREQVEHVSRKARVSDLARIMHGLRTPIFMQLRRQFDKRYPEDSDFAQRVDRWVSEQGIDTNYDWYSVFKDDKKFRAYILSKMKENGLPGVQSDFERKYRKVGHEDVTRAVNSLLRREGIPVDWPDKLCFEGAYSLINRLLFLRICEDTGFVSRELDSGLVNKLRSARTNEELVSRLEAVFAKMKSEYPGVYRLPLLDHLNLGDLEWDSEAVSNLCEETLRYNFSELGDVLGHLYQKHLDHNARRLIGQFYTHEEKVEFMLESVLPWLHEGAKILDPACGSGSFLVGAHKIMFQTLVMNGYSEASAHKYLLEEMLYGVDIDSFAAQLAAINLLVRNMKEPVGSLRIYVGNSLTGNESLTRFGLEAPGAPRSRDPRGFEEDRTVEEVLRNGSFDVIVGNPPFFRVGLEDRVYGPVLRGAAYSCIRPSGAEMNIATLFLKRCIDLLNERVEHLEEKGGICALILPKSLTYVDEYKLIREYLLSKCSIHKVVDLGRGWSDVGIEHIIVVFERKLNGSDTMQSNRPIEVIHEVISFRRELYESHEVEPEIFYQDPRKRFLLYIFGPAKELHDRMNRVGTPLRDFGMTVWEGIRDDHNVSRSNNRTNPRSVPLLDGKSVRRWFTAPSEYVDSSDVRIPDGIKRKCRIAEKIVIKRVISSKVRIEAVIDREDSITHSSTTAVSFDDGTSVRYVAGLLNSRLMNLYIRDWMFNRTKLTMNFREEYLGEIPLPKNPPAEIRRRIENYVEQLETLWGPCSRGNELTDELKAESSRIKVQLDDAVYDLYSLTEAERRFVESLMPYSD